MDRSIIPIARRSTGLTPNHVVLIRLLAAVSVNTFLRKIELDEAVQINGELHEDQA